MAKTYKNLYPHSYDALITAWRKARRGKRYKSAAAAFEQNLDAELLGLYHELRDDAPTCPQFAGDD
jgi:hypothetical protein